MPWVAPIALVASLGSDFDALYLYGADAIFGLFTETTHSLILKRYFSLVEPFDFQLRASLVTQDHF